MTRPFISIIIPAYNEASYLGACLKSLKSQKHQKPIEIIVVDNASTDNTAAIAKQYDVLSIREDRKGVCSARQTGLSIASGEVIVSTDADCLYPPGWLESIERRFERNSDLAALVGTYRFSGVHTPNYLLSAWERLTIRLHYAFGWQLYVSAANLAFRRTLFKGYDTRLQSGGDELYVISELKPLGRIAFDISNPVITSSRRLQGRFFKTLLNDFTIKYLKGYFFHRKYNRTPIAQVDIRDEKHTKQAWFYALLGIILLLSFGLILVSCIFYVSMLIESLPTKPLTFIGFGALALGGLAYATFWPRSQLFLPSPWRVKTYDKIVALTFDDGPNEPYTSQIADIIESYNGRASFFQCGQNADQFPHITRRLAKAGHTIGNHTYDHSLSALYRPRLLLNSIRHTNQILEKNCGHSIRFFRSPWLVKSPIMAWAMHSVGLIAVAGQFISLREIKQTDGEHMARNCLKKIYPGSIIILHDSREIQGGDRTQTVLAVRTLCRILSQEGYRLVSLDELF